jgi:predicted RNA binding protein with dsRBD fold (UPF0201 family)
MLLYDNPLRYDFLINVILDTIITSTLIRDSMQATIYAPIYPTEETEKVIQAIMNVFPECKLEFVDKGLVGTTNNLEYFENLLKIQKIRAAARSVLFNNKHSNCLRFSLNKQAAFAGKVSFGLKSPPLGNIDVEIVGDNLDAYIDEIAPQMPASYPKKSSNLSTMKALELEKDAVDEF